MERAGFGIRLVAFLIDGVIFGVISWIVDWVLGSAFNVKESIESAGYLVIYLKRCRIWLYELTNSSLKGQVVYRKLFGGHVLYGRIV